MIVYFFYPNKRLDFSSSNIIVRKEQARESGRSLAIFSHSLLNYGKCSLRHHCVFHCPNASVPFKTYKSHVSLRLKERRDGLPSNRKRTGRFHSGRFVYPSVRFRSGEDYHRKRVRLWSDFVGFASRHLPYIFGRRFQR